MSSEMMPSNTRLGETLHVGRIVDRPDDDLLPGAFYFADQVGLDQRMVRDHILDGKFGPEAELGLRLANQAQRNYGVLRA